MTTQHREPTRQASSTRQLLSQCVTSLALCGAFATCACSSNAASPSGVGGATAAGGATASGGTAAALGGSTASGGVADLGGSTASGGASVGGAGGESAGGSGGSVAGAAGTGAGGSGGPSGGTTAFGGMGGTGGGGPSGGTTGNCAGNALSLSANTTGADPAAAYVDVDLGSDLPIGNSNRTVELWAYMKAADWAANVNTLFFYGIANNGKNPGFGLDFGKTTNGIGSIDPFANGAMLDNDNQPSGITVATSQWVHFAMTWDGTTILAYVNGVVKSTKSSAGQTLATGTSDLTIGGYMIENAYFADYIDEFRIWNVTRSASDINSTMKKALVGSETGLVGYWKFNEASGTTAADSVTTAGHTAHVGKLVGKPPATFATPNPPSPVACP